MERKQYVYQSEYYHNTNPKYQEHYTLEKMESQTNNWMPFYAINKFMNCTRAEKIGKQEDFIQVEINNVWVCLRTKRCLLVCIIENNK